MKGSVKRFARITGPNVYGYMWDLIGRDVVVSRPITITVKGNPVKCYCTETLKAKIKGYVPVDSLEFS